MQSAVGIREARLNLSKLVKLVQGGAQIVITDRGRAVGKLVPTMSRRTALEERIAQLRRQGLIRPEARSRADSDTPEARRRHSAADPPRRPDQGQ